MSRFRSRTLGETTAALGSSAPCELQLHLLAVQLTGSPLQVTYSQCVSAVGYSLRPGRRGRLSTLRVFLCKSVLCGACVWARRALNGRKWRFPARAVPLAVSMIFASLLTTLVGAASTRAFCHRPPKISFILRIPTVTRNASDG